MKRREFLFWHKQGGDTGLSGNEKKQKRASSWTPFLIQY
ncbi:hypothetical protein PARMER_02695 [Parabacteroides merdae ATCC 43184]|nr:hypothetical protein PARMER_02695 [Parabacteroides merdae ATCC 43184]